MFKNWQENCSKIITGKRKGPVAFLLRGILRVLSYGFGSLVACRNWAFDRRLLRRYAPPVPLVISVGNIVAGGTGKTPVTLMLANEFYPHTLLAILSRGYKSRAEKLSSPVMLCKGDGPLHPAEYCGDEPYLLAQHLPKAIVIVGKNRYAASNMAAHAGAQMILLDDGMQHRHLERDFEVIVVNASDAFGQGYFLPRGFLRENVKALSRAHLIVINHVQNLDHFAEMQKQLSKHSQAPSIGTCMEVAHIWSHAREEVPTIQGLRVGIFCGIAHPEHFEKTVRLHGADIVAHHFLPDHCGFEHNGLQQFAEECRAKGAELILCTEKDHVKLCERLDLSLPLAWLQMKLSIVAGQEHWKAFIQKAKQNIARHT